MIERILAIIGAVGAIVVGLNYIIRKSCLAANTLWELCKRGGWKKIAREESNVAEDPDK